MKTLVRLPNWIGDAVMATPMIRAVSSDPETEHLAVWGPPKTAVLFHHFPGVSQVFEIDPKTDPSSLQVIRQEHFDRIYLLPNSYSSARQAKNLGIRDRIGYRTQWRGPLLTRAIACGPRVRNLRMVEYYLHLLPEEIRILAEGPLPSLVVSEGERGAVGEKHPWLADATRNRLVGLAPGAAFGPAKQWPIPRFRELAHHLVEKGLPVVVLGGPDDRETGERIVAGLPSDRSFNLAGETTVREMMAVLLFCGVLVTNDSGPMHLADALGIPAVALFGSTDSTWTGPRRDHHVILQSDEPCNPCFLRECPIGYPCLEGIGVGTVFNAVLRVLETAKKAQKT